MQMKRVVQNTKDVEIQVEHFHRSCIVDINEFDYVEFRAFAKCWDEQKHPFETFIMHVCELTNCVKRPYEVIYFIYFRLGLSFILSLSLSACRAI
jgi:hypothetical protein